MMQYHVFTHKKTLQFKTHSTLAMPHPHLEPSVVSHCLQDQFPCLAQEPPLASPSHPSLTIAQALILLNRVFRTTKLLHVFVFAHMATSTKNTVLSLGDVCCPLLRAGCSSAPTLPGADFPGATLHFTPGNKMICALVSTPPWIINCLRVGIKYYSSSYQ